MQRFTVFVGTTKWEIDKMDVSNLLNPACNLYDKAFVYQDD